MKKVTLAQAVKALGGYTQYAARLVQIIKIYEEVEEKHTHTVEYQFKGQNPSKLPIPVTILNQLTFQTDDDGKLYVAVDNAFIKIATSDGGWKRLVLAGATENEVE